MPSTTYLGLAYPALSNAPNVPQDLQNLASGVDTKVSGVILCTSSTRPTSREGAVIYETDTDRMAKYNGSSWEYMAGSKTSFTPTLTASTTPPTMGTGAIRQGFYVYLPGPMVQFNFYIQFGTSGSSAGSGQYSVALPVTASSTPISSGQPAIGAAMARDDSAGAIRSGPCYIPSSALGTLVFYIDTSTTNQGSPWAWANLDYLAGSITYPI